MDPTQNKFLAVLCSIHIHNRKSLLELFVMGTNKLPAILGGDHAAAQERWTSGAVPQCTFPQCPEPGSPGTPPDRLS